MLKKTTTTALFLCAIITLSFLKTQVEESSIYQKKKFSKADRIDLAFQHEFDKTRDPVSLDIPKERLNEARELMDQKLELSRSGRRAKAVNLTWEERGPYNVGGRTKAILWDENDVNDTKVWAGAASGGLWYNNDITSATSEWQAVDDLMENLSISAIVHDPVNTNTMYIGTGEGHIIGSVRGAGMLKSTDGGTSWTHMIPGNGFYDTETNFHYVNDILVVDEGGSSGVLYVTTQESLNAYTYTGYSKSGQRGLWRSTDGGVNFTQYLSSYSMADLEIDSNGRIYAGTGRDLTLSYTARIFYSDDGTTWNTAYNPGSGDRVELAIAPSDADRIYAVAANGGSVAWMVKATSATSSPTTWSSITIPNHQDPTSFGGSCGVNCSNNGDFTRSSQAFYDLILKVDPTDEDVVWVGGIDLHKSTDEGANWSMMSTWFESGGNTCYCLPYVHADQHVLEYNPADATELLSGNDGGVFYSSDANAATPDWNARNQRYNVTQFYGGAINPGSGVNQFLAGAQDNGSQYFSGTGMITTSEASGGDGAYCNIDQDEPQYQWTQYVYNDYFCSSNTGVSFGSSQEFGSSTGRFINPSVYDDVEDIMYAAGANNQFLRWTNPQSCGTSGSFITASFGGHQVSALAVSPNVSNRVYFGTGGQFSSTTGSGELFYIDNAHSGNTVVDITGSGFPSNSYVSSIAVEDGDENHIVVTFSNYGVSSVWETTDGGSNWTDIEGDLPDMPVRWAVIHPEDENRVLLATELGVWSTDDTNAGSTSWDPHDDENFPHVRTDMLQLRDADYEMIAITHGRGLWSTNITLPTTSDPEISFSSATSTQTESTANTDGCQDYTDYTVTMEIANPPTGDAIVTLNDGTSFASSGYDYDFTTTNFTTPTNTMTFSSGASTNQSFTVRVYDDDAVESSENIVFTYAISGTTDAVAASSNQTHTLTINDNDAAPVASSTTYLMQEDFEGYANYAALTSAGWAQGSFGGSNTSQWTLGGDGALNGSVGVFISDDGTNHNYDGTGTAQMGLITPVMDGTGLTDITLDFNYICNGEIFSGTYYDYGGLLYIIDANDNGNVFDDGSFTLFETNIQGITSTTAYSTTLPSALNGQKFALGFYWVNDNSVSNQPPFAVDDIEIYSGVVGNTLADAASQTHTTNFGPNETVHFYDDASGDVILTLQNLSAHDYGCTSVTVATAGTGAMTMNGTTSEYYPLDKTLTITPTNNNASGSYTATMYYTQAEIDGWLTATSSSLASLDLIKTSGAFDGNMLNNSVAYEKVSPTVSSFGSNYTIQATFNTGFSTIGSGDADGWSTPVPVEMTFFTAELQDKTVQLDWQTASEINSDRFEIEHSADGQVFEKIGERATSLNSNELRDYSFEHPKPAVGINYYRLKQIDVDGTFEYVGIKQVTLKPEALKIASVSPNPARDYLKLQFETEKEVRLKLISVEGKIVLEELIHSTGLINKSLAVGHLKRGVYFVQLDDGFETRLEKVVLR